MRANTGSMELRPGKDGVISQQMSTTVMSTSRPFTKLIKDSALSFAKRGFLGYFGFFHGIGVGSQYLSHVLRSYPTFARHYCGIWFSEWTQLVIQHYSRVFLTLRQDFRCCYRRVNIFCDSNIEICSSAIKR